MAERSTFTGLFDMLKYEDALRHIDDNQHEFEGLTGPEVLRDENHPATIWHEFAHLFGVVDHDHLNNHEATVSGLMQVLTSPDLAELVDEELSNPEVLNDLIESRRFLTEGE